MSRLLKLSVSLLVFLWDLIRQSVLRVVGKDTGPSHVVLTYHAVRAEEQPLFARQMAYLARHKTVVPLEPRFDFREGTRYASVTFDDAFASIAQNALPALEQYGIPCTIFVPTGCLGQVPGWIQNAPSFGIAREVVMDAPQLEMLSQKTGVTLASHGRTHVDLTRVSREAAKDEINGSKRDLEAITGYPITAFSFPYGGYFPDHIEMVREAGYRFAVSILPERILPGKEHFVRGRVSVDPSDWPLEFSLKVACAYRWLPAAFALKKRIRKAIA